ncbi:DUF4334 domain-containing protein [Anditalea andensis]|uniref:DUF4334 domain-containing protein n=1 Tax=Anditalea andensis TaxID=1048983 RepID=UPI0021CD8ED5|nr:DUF4334 domain-containing protein [Anditalea andensis]
MLCDFPNHYYKLHPKARWWMIEHIGKFSATMIYAGKVIWNNFRKIDDIRALRLLDLKGGSTPYLFFGKIDHYSMDI